MENRVIRDGQLAVIISAGFGSGWSTRANNQAREILAFHPTLVAMVESGRGREITEDFLYETFGLEDLYCGGQSRLIVTWVAVGERFRITEYDGSEGISLASEMPYTA